LLVDYEGGAPDHPWPIAKLLPAKFWAKSLINFSNQADLEGSAKFAAR
jgi:hypothetical protein